MSDFGLTGEEIRSIQTVFSKYTQIEKVVLYGSRSAGEFKPYSDIDLSLFGNKIDTSLLTRIEFDLDDLLLPFKFDITVFNKISNIELLRRIDEEGKVIYDRQLLHTHQ